MLDDNGKPTGLWRYTCRNDDKIWAVGNCSPYDNCPDCKGQHHAYLTPEYRKDMGILDCSRCDNKGFISKENPCPGHATPEDACEHQRLYELDQAQYYQDTPEIRAKVAQLQRCRVCQEFTCGAACYGNGHMQTVYLCPVHCNRENLDKFVKAGCSISSC